MITLQGLLNVISSTKDITINLYNKNNLLIITFIMRGFPALEDIIEESEITKIEIVNMTTLNITLNYE